MGWELCRTIGGWLLLPTGFAVYWILVGGLAYWKAPLVFAVAVGVLVGALWDADVAV